MNGVPPKGANDATVAQQDATNQPRRNGQENSSNVIVGIMGATLIRSAARAADHETVLANSNDEDEDDANVANNNLPDAQNDGSGRVNREGTQSLSLTNHVFTAVIAINRPSTAPSQRKQKTTSVTKKLAPRVTVIQQSRKTVPDYTTPNRGMAVTKKAAPVAAVVRNPTRKHKLESLDVAATAATSAQSAHSRKPRNHLWTEENLLRTFVDAKLEYLAAQTKQPKENTIEPKTNNEPSREDDSSFMAGFTGLMAYLLTFSMLPSDSWVTAMLSTNERELFDKSLYRLDVTNGIASVRFNHSVGLWYSNLWMPQKPIQKHAKILTNMEGTEGITSAAKHPPILCVDNWKFRALACIGIDEKEEEV